MTVPSELVALMGAERLGKVAHESDTSKAVFKFHQKVPIPSYLISLVVGALESRLAVNEVTSSIFTIFNTHSLCVGKWALEAMCGVRKK